MASKRRTAGFEPARGFPDPDARTAPHTPDAVTHKPNPNGGTVCGLFPIPTQASAYDDEDPSCATCGNYQRAAKAVTAKRHPETVAPSKRPAASKALPEPADE